MKNKIPSLLLSSIMIISLVSAASAQSRYQKYIKPMDSREACDLVKSASKDGTEFTYVEGKGCLRKDADDKSLEELGITIRHPERACSILGTHRASVVPLDVSKPSRDITLANGDSIFVPEDFPFNLYRVEVYIPGGVVYPEPSSLFTFPCDEKRPFSFSGSISEWLHNGGGLQVETKNVAATTKGTHFVIDARLDTKTIVAVVAGALEVKSKNSDSNPVLVATGNQVTASHNSVGPVQTITPEVVQMFKHKESASPTPNKPSTSGSGNSVYLYVAIGAIALGVISYFIQRKIKK